MRTSKKFSFGVRLRKGQDLVAYINGFANYSPPRLLESPGEVSSLVNSIAGYNAAEAEQVEIYRNATFERAKAFRKSQGSIDAMATAIRSAVIAQYGTRSAELNSVNIILRRLRSNTVIKTEAETVPNEPADSTTARTRSHSERSYAATTQIFNNLVSTLGKFNAYDPAITSLKLPALQVVGLNLTTLNDAVANSVKALKSAREARDLAFTDFNERVLRIKAYVKAQYGTKSEEAKLIAGLGI
jgi:hypothetical protein